MLPRPGDAKTRYVFVLDLADYLGVNPNALAKRIARAKFATAKIVNEERGRWSAAVTDEDAKAIVEMERGKPRIIKPEELFNGHD